MTDTTDSGFLDPTAFGQAFKAFLERIVDHVPRPESAFSQRLSGHFGTDPIALPVVSSHFALYDHPNLQLALDAWLATATKYDVVGVPVHPHQQVYLSELVTNSWAEPGPVTTVERPVGVDQVLACLASIIRAAR